METWCLPQTAGTHAILQTAHRKGRTTVSPPPGPCCPRRQPRKSRTGSKGTGCAYRALPKKSFRAATTWVTYSGLSYRSTWLAPSTTWIFLGSLARR